MDWVIITVIGIVVLFGIGCYTKLKLREMDFRCRHEWKTVEKEKLYNNEVLIGSRIIQQCVHCGSVRSKDLDGTDKVD